MSPSEESVIPLSRPCMGEEEERAAVRAIKSGAIGGGGPLGRKLGDLVQEMFGVRHALAVTSCTHALEMAMLALDVRTGDEVICPSFAFVSAANAVVLRAARVVFADIEEESLGIDPVDFETRITPRTRGVIVIHYAGVPCRMGEILKIARKHDLFVVEDAAQAVGSAWQGVHMGTLGEIGCYSLHVTKNITCGEGGVFLTNDSNLFARAEIIREKGTDRSQFLRGEISKYLWQAPGSSYVPADVLCAIAIEQLHKLGRINKARERIYTRYMEELAPLEQAGKIRLPTIPAGASPNWHIFHILLADPSRRDPFLDGLRERRINAAFHFVPLHTAPYWREIEEPPELPVTDRVASSLVRLPLYPDLRDEEQKRVIAAVFKLLG